MTAILPFLILGTVISLFVVIFRKASRQREEQKQLMQEFGFTEVSNLDPDLQTKVIRLRQVGSGKATINKAYMRRQGYYSLYLLDVWTGGKSESSTRWVTGIVSRELDLPTFALGPSLPIKGTLGSWLNKAINWSLERHGYSAVALPAGTKGADDFMFYAQDPKLAASFFPPAFWERLAGSGIKLMMEGTGDLLLFWVMPWGAEARTASGPVASHAALRSQLDLADKIFGWFRESGRTTKSAQAGELATVLDTVSLFKKP
jgi:hypothetical protein